MSINEENPDLWDLFLEAAGSKVRSSDIAEVIGVAGSPYDPDEMEFEGDFRLKDGSSIRVKARYSPSWDAVEEASVALLP